MLLATYRCQEAMNRLEMTVRTVEGQYGDLQAMVLAKMEPKTAQSVRVSIKPLSLHHRLQGDIDDRPVNTLRITGSFTLGQMHEWVCFCLPDVPARTLDSEVNMAFRNVYLGSVLSAQYRYPYKAWLSVTEHNRTVHSHSHCTAHRHALTCSKGEATFKSDSVSTIAILKEVITKQATALKVLPLPSKRARQLPGCVGSFTRGTTFVVAFRSLSTCRLRSRTRLCPTFCASSTPSSPTRSRWRARWT